MTTVKLDDLELMFFEHYGVKSMDWGVRNREMGVEAINTEGKKLHAAAQAKAKRDVGRNATNQLLSDFS